MRSIKVQFAWAAGCCVAVSMPASGAIVSTITDSFTGNAVNTSTWSETDKGIENGNDAALNPSAYTNPAGYNQPSESASGLVLGGTTSVSYWEGDSLESVNQLPINTASTVQVTRASLTGSGSAYRSSLWIYQDSTHYIHFAQDVNEMGWQYNADDAGSGSPVGEGVAITNFNAAPFNTTGSHVMEMTYAPGTSTVGPTISLYLDGTLGATVSFANPWTSSGYTSILTGEGRASGDTVEATFTNFSATVTPEPASLSLLALAGAGLLARRRRKSAVWTR